MDDAERGKSWRKIWTFLGLMTVLTLCADWVSFTQKEIPNVLRAALVMWAPGTSAIVVKLFYDRSLAGLGLGKTGGRWLWVGLLLPVLYALPVYASVWASGMGGFDPQRWGPIVPYIGNPGNAWAALGLLLLLGIIGKLARATGEEIGWRGLLVPELLKHMPLWKAGLISGVIWFLYHTPLILFGTYNAQGGPPIGYQLACFAVMVVSSSVFYAWLRDASSSVWPCALLHASHNLLIQSVFDRATVNGPSTAWITGEFGFGLALTSVAVALAVLAKRSRAPQVAPA